jgi:hypothetical protein
MSGDERRIEAAEHAAGILLTSEESCNEIADVILYEDIRGRQKLAVLHAAPMHDNFFIGRDSEMTQYDGLGFVQAVLARRQNEFPQHLREAPVDIGCVASSMVEDVPYEWETALKSAKRELMNAIAHGRCFSMDTGRFSVSASAQYPTAFGKICELNSGIIDTLVQADKN